MVVYISQSQYPKSSHPFPLLVSLCLFSTCVSLFLLCKQVHLYHYTRFHICVLMHNIHFFLSNLLHYVWQSLGLPTFLQMAQFHSFLWLSNIPLHYVPHLYPFLCRAFRLLPCPSYCKQCCNEHSMNLFELWFSVVYALDWDFWVIW